MRLRLYRKIRRRRVNFELVFKCIVPYPCHVLPIHNNSSFNRMYQRKDFSSCLCLWSNKRITPEWFFCTYHSLENGAWRIFPWKPCFDWSRTVINDNNLTITDQCRSTRQRFYMTCNQWLYLILTRGHLESVTRFLFFFFLFFFKGSPFLLNTQNTIVFHYT